MSLVRTDTCSLPEVRKKQFYHEPGVVALLLAFRGADALSVFVAYFVLNGALFLFLFQP